MRVSLRDSDEFQLQSSLTRTRTVCVCGGDSDTLRYLVTPLKIGKINIQAEVRTIIYKFFTNTSKQETVFNFYL